MTNRAYGADKPHRPCFLEPPCRISSSPFALAAEPKIQTLCPVMTADPVSVKDARSATYKGVTVLLCCDACVGKFRRDPAAYLDPKFLPAFQGQELPKRSIEQVFCPVYRDRKVSAKDPSVTYKGVKVYVFNDTANCASRRTPRSTPIPPCCRNSRSDASPDPAPSARAVGVLSSGGVIRPHPPLEPSRCASPSARWASPCALSSPLAAAEPPVYEMRVYYRRAGQARRPQRPVPRPHPQAVREARHRQRRLLRAGWTNKEDKLVYFLSYPDKAARDASWKAFMADPDWKAALKASEKDGKLVAKVESKFLTADRLLAGR